MARHGILNVEHAPAPIAERKIVMGTMRKRYPGIVQAGPGRWRVIVRLRRNGRIYHRQDTITGTLEQARAKSAELKDSIRTGAKCSLKLSTISTFKEAVDFYLERHEEGRSKPLFDRLKNDLGGVLIADMGERFDKWILLMRASKRYKIGTPLKAGTINRYIAWTKAVLNFAVRHGLIEKNPVRHIEKLEETPRDRYLVEDERARLFNAIRETAPYLEPFIRYSIMVPCRKGELVSLPGEAYNAITNTVYVPDSKAGIPIYKPVPDEMKSYFRNIPADCPYLFYRTIGGNKRKPRIEYRPLGDFKKAWRACLKKAKIVNCRIHDLRHCAASDLTVAGNSERVIMDIAGWKTPMLSTYWHKNSLRSAQMIRFPGQCDSAVIVSKAVNE